MAKRRSYTNKEKLNAVKLTQTYSNRKVAKMLDVSESSIREWKKSLATLTDQPRRKRSNRFGLPKFPELETALLKRIEKARSNCNAVSAEMVIIWAKIEAFGLGISGNDFKASRNWVTRFLKRHGYSHRRRTHICQRLPEEYEEKLLSFQRFIIRERQLFYFEPNAIANADQTPVFLDMPSQITINKSGEKTVTIKTTGNEKMRITCMLAAMSDGTKLPPYIILNRKTIPKDPIPNGLAVRAQEKGWMNEALVIDWVKTIWQYRPDGLRNKKSLLVLDSYAAHKCESVRRALYNNNTRLAIIPGGMTCILQPMDVCLNKPFKANLKKMWSQWMIEGPHTFTPAGNIVRPSYPIVYGWILAAWAAIPEEMIVKSFKKCCISNALDGSEDDILFEDELQDGEVAVLNEEEDLEMENETSSEEDATEDGVDAVEYVCQMTENGVKLIKSVHK